MATLFAEQSQLHKICQLGSNIFFLSRYWISMVPTQYSPSPLCPGLWPGQNKVVAWPVCLTSVCIIVHLAKLFWIGESSDQVTLSLRCQKLFRKPVSRTRIYGVVSNLFNLLPYIKCHLLEKRKKCERVLYNFCLSSNNIRNEQVHYPTY